MHGYSLAKKTNLFKGRLPMSEVDSLPPTYSISVRLRRTTLEYAYVRVPVTDGIMQTDDHGTVKTDEKGHAHIDPEKMVQRAMEILQAGPPRWYPEGEKIEPHPIQKGPEGGEQYTI